MSVTIHAAHLTALGFEKGDSPVQSATGLPVGFKQREVLQRSPRTLLSVEHSMPTLLRALARHHGAKLEPGEVPQWYEDRKGAWWLICGTGDFEQGFGPAGHVDIGVCAEAVPALAERMPRLEALAAVIAWLVTR